MDDDAKHPETTVLKKVGKLLWIRDLFHLFLLQAQKRRRLKNCFGGSWLKSST